MLTITQSTYDGVSTTSRTIKEMLDGKIDTLHFDEAWLPHAAFPRFLRGLPCDRRRPAALQGVDDFLDAVHAQAAGRPEPGLADPGAGSRTANSIATSSTKPT
jgi:arginine decarboxylase